MIRTIFCLSMPGGHMSYLGTIVSALLGRIELRSNMITSNGTSHGANPNFPVEFYNPISVDHKRGPIDHTMWMDWYQNARNNHASDGILVLKDGWYLYGDRNWGKSMDSIPDSCVIVSSPNTRVDWIYCYLQMSRKIQRHLYCSLREKSPLYPKLWKMLKKTKRMSELSSSMPGHPLRENIISRHPLYRFHTTDLFSETWIDSIIEFLADQGYSPEKTKTILDFHQLFLGKQKNILLRAKQIADGHLSLDPANIWEEILFDFLSRQNPWDCDVIS